jgi:hypothetical protein
MFACQVGTVDSLSSISLLGGPMRIGRDGTRISGLLRERQVRTFSDQRNTRVRLKPSQQKKSQVVGSVREGWSSGRA